MKKVIRIIIVLNLIITMIFIPITTVNASIGAAARGESGHSIPPQTPPDAKPTTPTPSQPEIPSNVTPVEIFHEKISGKVYENLGRIHYVQAGRRYDL